MEDALDGTESPEFSEMAEEWLDSQFEDVKERKLNPRRSSEFGKLTIYEGLNEGERVFYMESSLLEDLLGYSLEDLTSRLNEHYHVPKEVFDDVTSYEYGNRWVLFYWEE